MKLEDIVLETIWTLYSITSEKFKNENALWTSAMVCNPTTFIGETSTLLGHDIVYHGKIRYRQKYEYLSDNSFKIKRKMEFIISSDSSYPVVIKIDIYETEEYNNFCKIYKREYIMFVPQTEDKDVNNIILGKYDRYKYRYRCKCMEKHLSEHQKYAIIFVERPQQYLKYVTSKLENIILKQV